MSKCNIGSADFVSRITRSIGLALIMALPLLAQSGSSQTPPNLKGSLDGIPKAPTLRDANGNPIPAQAPTDAQLEAARKEEVQRAADRRAAEERQAQETRRLVDEQRAVEHLAEEQTFHSRIMTAVYVGLALMVVLVGVRIFKRS
jgi:hypothetical protein